MNKTKRSVENTQVVYDIKAEVVFGSPGRGCAGSGVCRLIPFQKLKIGFNPCPRLEAKIEWHNDGCLDLIFDVAKLTNEELLKWFSNPYFLVEEDFFFPLWFQHKLGQKNIYIPKGRYPFVVKNGELRLFFPWEKDISQNNLEIKRMRQFIKAL